MLERSWAQEAMGYRGELACGSVTKLCPDLKFPCTLNPSLNFPGSFSCSKLHDSRSASQICILWDYHLCRMTTEHRPWCPSLQKPRGSGSKPISSCGSLGNQEVSLRSSLVNLSFFTDGKSHFRSGGKGE